MLRLAAAALPAPARDGGGGGGEGGAAAARSGGGDGDDDDDARLVARLAALADEWLTELTARLTAVCRDAIGALEREFGDGASWCGRDYAEKLRVEAKQGFARPLPPKRRIQKPNRNSSGGGGGDARHSSGSAASDGDHVHRETEDGSGGGN